MAVPSVITDLNVTAGSNSPAGTDPIGSTLDDFLRAAFSILRREQAQGAAIASSATTNIGATTDGNYVHITGTTTITSFGTVAAGVSRTVVFDGILTLTHNSTSLILPGAASITTAAGDVAEFISEGAGNWRCLQYLPIAGLFPSAPPRGHLAGMQMSANTGSSATITISAGEATDSTNAFTLRLSSSISKTTSNWAVGSTNGGLDTGTIANNTTYHFYVIKRPDTGVQDVIFSTNASTPSLPTNYTQFRRIFSWRTNGSAQWTAGTQDGDFFQLTSPPNDISSIPSTATLRAISVPTGISVIARIGFVVTNSAGGIGSARHWDPALSSVAPATLSGSIRTFVNTTVLQSCNGVVDIRTNTSGQIYNDGDAANITAYTLQTLGWFDQRGRNT